MADSFTDCLIDNARDVGVCGNQSERRLIPIAASCEVRRAIRQGITQAADP